MRTQSMDTSPEAERVQIALIRKAPLTKRFGLARSLTKTITWANLQETRKSHPNASEEEIALIFATYNYGQVLADGLHAALHERTPKVFSTTDPLAAMTPLVEIFEQLGIAYHIEGSVAITTYGMQRTLTSIELVADLSLEQAPLLLSKLEAAYFVDEEAMREAVQRHTSFSGIHFESLMKFDVFLPSGRMFDQAVRRRVQTHILAENNHPFCLASPEDVILTQLEGYKRGCEVADDQWNDILGVLKVQGANLDLIYLQQWATTLEVAKLLEDACVDAGFREKRTRKKHIRKGNPQRKSA